MPEASMSIPRDLHETRDNSLSPAESRLLVLTGPRALTFETNPLFKPRPGEVLAASMMSGISHGTEMAWYRGEATALHRTWDPQIRAYVDGPGRDYPVAPGYETVARIVQVGTDVHDVVPGHLVYLDRPHADVHLVREQDAVRGLLPESVTAETAVFLPLTRVALGGIHDAQIRIGECVAVVGLGTIGLIAVQLALIAGARKVIGIDRVPLRLDAAQRLGAMPVNASTHDTAYAVQAYTGMDGVDVAIEASGDYGGLHTAIRACRVGGRVVTVSSYRGPAAGLALGEEYHRNRITLISSMTVNDCPQRGHPLWTKTRLDETAWKLLATRALRVEHLITHRIPFDTAHEAYDLIDTAPETTIKVVLTHDR